MESYLEIIIINKYKKAESIDPVRKKNGSENVVINLVL